jgi:hypothetical protein
VKSTSDRCGGNQRKAVRTRCDFEQGCRKSEESCPNQVQLQTGLKGISGKLSEPGVTSDRFGGNQRKAVRTRCNFRQVWRKSKKSCPNQVQLQTGLEEIKEKLSELGATSDRFEGNQRKAVRTRSNFRQVWRESVKSCPN